ncbi:16S ribosomal RNA methyltransferase A [Haladaptatus sp. GCM10025707]|uniref:16S ribosomal RNA methyltransferase A n=1 Tax=unclassified Haladaptatus TaxID=2622732 RepID=UPI0023E7E99B|nr:MULTISPECIES: 16S ribosomal RNA methyltransferase A [unclassified Haladaptatus]
MTNPDGSETTRDPTSGHRRADALIKRAGVRADTNQDQHFLVDDRVLDRLPTHATGADIDLSHVLEIGPGAGVLTARLLAVADRVTAVERDKRFAEFLRREFAEEIDAGRLTLIEGDALDVDLPDDVTASISNLPYSVSSEISFRLLPREIPLILMFQKEFAERMAAAPATDEYGRLSVTAGHYADIDVVETVPKSAFSPPPQVESAIVRAMPRKPEYEVPDDEFFLNFVTAVFTQRRKTMRNAVRNTAHISHLGDPKAVVAAADEDLMSMRAGKVTPAQFAELATLAYEVGDPDV